MAYVETDGKVAPDKQNPPAVASSKLTIVSVVRPAESYAMPSAGNPVRLDHGESLASGDRTIKGVRS